MRAPRTLAMLALAAAAAAARADAKPVALAAPPHAAPHAGRAGAHVASLAQFGRRRKVVPANDAPCAPPAHRPRPWRIALNILLWWFLNVLFNLANKECLNSWPHPWALATLHQAIGSLCMLPLYIPLPWRKVANKWTSIRQFPLPSRSELRTVMSVVWLLAIGHVTSTLAPAYGTVAFSNIVKTAEPFFTCIFSYMLHRRLFPPPVYFSLLLVVSGVALVSTRDINFSSFSLCAGMVSNAAFALYSIRVKKVMQGSSHLTPRATYALLTICSCLLLAPLACVVELLGGGTSSVSSAIAPAGLTGWRLVALLICTGAVQYLSNEIAFCTLSMIHPVTYAVANTLKRSIVVGASLIFFGQRLPLSGGIGAMMAIFGAMAYSLAMANGHGWKADDEE